MITTEKLYKLISTLQSAEKKYFRQMVAKQEGADPQYMQLFNMMAENISFDPAGEPVFGLDEAALIARMKRKKVPESRFHVVRYQLVQMLFKALRLMQEEHNQEDTIKIQLKNAKLLERRGIFDWAEEMTEEALWTANRYEYHALAVEALSNLLYLSSHRDSRGYSEKIRDYVREIEFNAQRYLNEIQLFSLWHQSFALYRTKKGAPSAEVSRQVEKLLQRLEQANFGEGGSFLSKVYALQSRATLTDLQGGSQAARPWFAKILELWESEDYRHIQAERPRSFIIHLANYLSFCLSVKAFDVYEHYFRILDDFKPDNSDDEAEVFQNSVFLQQLYFLNKNMPEEARKLIPVIEKGLKKYAFKINKSRLFTIRYHIILTHFILSEYEKALQHCEILQRYGKSDQRRDVQLFTNILRHIAHLELDEFDALERFVKSVKSNLSTATPTPDFERTVLTYLAELARLYLKHPPKSRERKEALSPVWDRFLDSLTAFRDAGPAHLPLGFEETLLWVKSKKSGRAVRDYLGE